MVKFGSGEHKRLWKDAQAKKNEGGGKEPLFKTEKSLLEIAQMSPEQQADVLDLKGWERDNFLDSFRK